MHARLLLLLLTGAWPVAPALAGDPDAFLAGTTKSCIECNLAGASLSEHDFQRVKLDRANLEKADLAGSSLFRATLTGANLKGANFKGAIMPDGSIHE